LCQLGGTPILCALLLAALSGCLTSAPLAPHPTVVYVPHPDQADPSLDMETLREMYTASPDVNPDGFGSMDWIWDQSYMTLLVWPVAEKEQELAGRAFARTEQEQRQSIEATRLLLDNFAVFEGFLVGDFSQLLDMEVFKPEGIYLLNDRGEKFYPVFAETGKWTVPQFGAGISEFGAAHYSRSLLAFPRQALLPETRSISLYLATPQRRIVFTWVFDPSYEPPGGAGGPRQRRLWSTR
jgi:hypothetical protein